jgi:hypothetical protein
VSDVDEFDTDKGVKDDYDGVIVDAHFSASQQGDINLVLKKKADDGDEVEDFYRVGTDWASFDGGETVEHPSKSKVRADSQLAVLVDRAMLSGAEAVIRDRSAENGRKGQRTARLWPGLKFHWDVEEKPYEFKSQRTGEDVKGVSFKSYPTRFLGVEEVVHSGDNSEDKSAPSQAQMPPDIMARLKVLAQAKSFAEWVDEALTIDWVRENLLSALSDESFYNSLKEGS